jgi:hypothetical protein
MKLLPTILRLLLSAGLLVLAYQETGPWTTLSLALLFLNTELAALGLQIVKRGL